MFEPVVQRIRLFVFLLGIALFVLILALPEPEGLSPEGKKSLAIFSLCVFLWVTQVIPLMITSILAIILFPIMGVLGSAETYAFFGTEAVFFILGAFILGSALMRCGLSTRIALFFLRALGHNPHTLFLGLFLIPAFMSFFMSEHAVAAMIFPIVIEITQALKLGPGSSYAKRLVLALAWGSCIGGVATFLGGARAPLAVGILNKMTGEGISFGQWALAALPTVLVMMGLGYALLVRFFPSEVRAVHPARKVLGEQARKLGRISGREKGMGVLMMLTVLSWIFLGERFGLATIAMAAVFLGFAFNLMKWEEVESDVNWGIVLMYGGAICLGLAMERTGGAQWLADHSIGYVVHSPALLIPVLSLLALVFTEAISNTAVVAVFIPPALLLAKEYGVDPHVMTLAITIPSGLAFVLPIGTPATALAFSSGYIRQLDTLMGGTLLKLLGWVVFNVLALLYWPLLGLKTMP
jgi:sodium-dependent dicarboxylate transporter 2/3/5